MYGFFIILSLILCRGLFLHAQQMPKTLLWRIDGNQFSKPSYLYGTIHLRDRRVYILGDSVYSSIKQAAGFAMELDPGDLIDSIIADEDTKKLTVDYKKIIEKSTDNTPVDFRESQRRLDSFMLVMKNRYKNFTTRDINRLARAYNRRKRNDMKTVLDLYLYDLAKKQGKIVGGVEDINDQTSIKDEMGNSLDEEYFLKKQKKKYADVLEFMIGTYEQADLDKIEAFSKESQPPASLTAVLYNRNNKMAIRMDSLGKIRPTFFAVGSAHLPGDSGVINLLRQKGYNLTPVFSSKKIDPEDYVLENISGNWITITDADSNFVAAMPGKPTVLTAITDKLILRTYKELSNEILLMAGVIEDGSTGKNIDIVLDELKAKLADNFVKLKNITKIKKQDLDGYDFSFKNTSGYIRMQLFYYKRKTYAFAIGAQEKDSLLSTKCTRFLQSYQMDLNKVNTDARFVKYTSDRNAFTVAFPTLPKLEFINGEKSSNKEDVTLYSSIDLKKKISYVVLVKEPHKGFYPDFDSVQFTQAIKEMAKGIPYPETKEENIMVDGNRALKVKLKGEIDGDTLMVQIVLLNRQNRFYTITTRGTAIKENEAIFEFFFNSFQFLPYANTVFKKQYCANNIFSVLVPSKLQMQPLNIDNNSNDEVANSRLYYYAYDTSNSVTYGISSVQLHKLYYTENEDSLLNDYSKIYLQNISSDDTISNSLIYNKIMYNGNFKSRELFIKNNLNNIATRIRILYRADTVYTLISKADKALLETSKTDSFFNSFTLTDFAPLTKAFESKTALLIAGLQSPESTERMSNLDFLQTKFCYPKKDEPIILKALLIKYPQETYNATIDLLTALLAKNPSNEIVEFIRVNYAGLKGKQEDVRMKMLELLSSYQNEVSYQLLKAFLLNDPPANHKYDLVIKNCKNAPALTIGLFPELASRIPDQYLSIYVVHLAQKLIEARLLNPGVITDYKEDIIVLGKKILKQYPENGFDLYDINHVKSILKLLAIFNQKSTTNLLNDYLDIFRDEITMLIITALIDNNRPVPGDRVERICKDPEQLVIFYEGLKKIGKESFLKGEYGNQKAFALAIATISCREITKTFVSCIFEIAAIKDVAIKGEMSRFYIVKVIGTNKYSTQEYTTIIGPFSTDPSKFSIEKGKEQFVFYDEKYQKQRIPVLFDNYLEEINKSRK